MLEQAGFNGTGSRFRPHFRIHPPNIPLPLNVNEIFPIIPLCSSARDMGKGGLTTNFDRDQSSKS